MQGGSRGNFWGALIRQLRFEMRLSQRQLAVSARVNRSTLRRIEEGTARGDIHLIEALLEVLGYELEALHREVRRAPSPTAPIEIDFSAYPNVADFSKFQIKQSAEDRSRQAMHRLLAMTPEIRAAS